MLVFWKEKLTILAVPKTGTTALEHALGNHADLVVRDPPQLKHAPVYRYNRFFRPMFEKQGAPDMETLAVMREPISWLSSWYRYRARPFMEGKPNSTARMSFDDFVNAYIKGEKPGFANVGSQLKFLEPRPNGTEVTHLFRYDDQEAMIAWIAHRLRRDITLERANVSPKVPASLSPEVERKAKRKLTAEFELYASIPDGGRHVKA
ncbi:gamma-glutamyl kinase [Primorskyibacter sp. S187A]|uniref:gamma-glutamyl kinase n=1 Tax=Primorskyibacter sp. S187A TaxID=3415130 RepID=UPI003C7D1A7F